MPDKADVSFELEADDFVPEPFDTPTQGAVAAAAEYGVALPEASASATSASSISKTKVTFAADSSIAGSPTADSSTGGSGGTIKPSGQSMDVDSGVLTRSEVCEIACNDVLIKYATERISLKALGNEVLKLISTRIAAQNGHRKTLSLAPLTNLQELKSSEVVSILLARELVVRVSLTGRKYADEFDILGLYQHSGEMEGVYLDSEKDIRDMLSEINPHAGDRGLDDAMNFLRIKAPFRVACKDPDLVPVKNGVFQHSTKSLLPHSPERVFLMKRPVNYVESLDLSLGGPRIPDIDGTDWDVESWMQSLHDDPEVVQVYWELASATIRSNVAWDKAAFLYSSYGSNGKGTLTRLLRGLVGEDNAASIQMTEFGDRFALGGLTKACAIIVDENDVGGYTEKGSRFKAVVTGDRFQIERKHKDPGDIAFRGMVIQCINDFPKAKDKSDSFARRQLFVPFDKRFEGRENKAIKEVYVVREDVLEYVLKRALHMDHMELSEPAACKALKETYRRENDTVREFWAEFENEFVWDLLPTSFMYDLYTSWFNRTNPRGTVLNQRRFVTDLAQTLDGSSDWDFSDTQKKIRPGSKMSVPEPLILAYELDRWSTPGYKGTAVPAACMPQLAVNYRGVLRMNPKGATGPNTQNTAAKTDDD